MGQRVSVTCCSSFRSILSRFCDNLDLLRCRLEQTFYGKQHELCSSIAINVNFIFIVFTHSNTRQTNLNLNHQQPVSCKHVDCFVQNYRFEIITLTHTEWLAEWSCRSYLCSHFTHLFVFIRRRSSISQFICTLAAHPPPHPSMWCEKCSQVQIDRLNGVSHAANSIQMQMRMRMILFSLCSKLPRSTANQPNQFFNR